MIGQIVSHYRILEPLGEGGMGVVYLAEDTHLGRRVAIKFLNAERHGHQYRARFLREARAASALSHPNIAIVYDYGETAEGHPFIVMELVTGQTLSELLKGGALAPERAAAILTEVAEALAAAHRIGIVHRDIKPSNIAINTQEQVKVLDFGLAKQIGDEFAHVAAAPDVPTMLMTKTREGMIVGTPLYLSPEQARGAQVDARSDLFSLGSVLYEALTGKAAFDGASLLEVCAQVLHYDPPPPSSHNALVSPALDHITLKALAKNAGERYQAASEFADDLRTVQPKSDAVVQQIRTQRYSPHLDTSRVKVLGTVTHAFRRPRVMLPALFLLILLLGFLSAWYARNLWPHQAPANSMYQFDEGIKAIHDGTYFKASQALAKAVQLDPDFGLGHARLAEAWMEMDYPGRAKDEMMTAQALLRKQMTWPSLLLRPSGDRFILEAIDATIRRDFAGAIKSYDQIAHLLPDEPHVYIDLGRAYEKDDQINQAIENYSKAIQLNQNYAAPYLHLGILYSRKKDFQKADEAFNQADNLYSGMSNLEGMTEVHYQRGTLLNKRNALPEAQAELQKALTLARENSDNYYQQIKTLLQLSSVSYAGNRTKEAEQLANEAISLAENNRMQNLATRGLIDLGNAFLMRDDLKEAEKYFGKALDLASLDGGGRNKARAQLSLASLSLQQNKFDEAVEYVSQALPFYQGGGYAEESSQAFLLKAQAQSLRGEYEAAHQIFNQQLEAALQSGDRTQAALAHEGLGTVLALQEQYTEAESHFTESRKLYEATGNQLNTGYNLIYRGDALWRLGRYDEAREMLRQASLIAEQSDGSNKQLQPNIHLIQSLIALSNNDYKASTAHSRQAIDERCADANPACVEAKDTGGLADVRMGLKSKTGLILCHEAWEMAKRFNDPRLLSQSQLALAEAMLENGETKDAFDNASSAQQRLNRYGQQESEWRAWLIMARSSEKTGRAAQYGLTARRGLARLQEKWGQDVFATYSTRPDVRWHQEQLTSIVSSSIGLTHKGSE